MIRLISPPKNYCATRCQPSFFNSSHPHPLFFCSYSRWKLMTPLVGLVRAYMHVLQRLGAEALGQKSSSPPAPVPLCRCDQVSRTQAHFHLLAIFLYWLREELSCMLCCFMSCDRSFAVSSGRDIGRHDVSSPHVWYGSREISCGVVWWLLFR